MEMFCFASGNATAFGLAPVVFWRGYKFLTLFKSIVETSVSYYSGR